MSGSVPPFAEEWLRHFRWIADPPPDIYTVLKGDQLARVAQLGVKFRLQLAQLQVEYYRELSALTGVK